MLTSMLSANSPAWLLVFARMGGLLGMNPLFARRNVPSTVRAGLVFLMTALIAPTVTVTGLPARDSLALVVAMLKELFVGFACGYVFQIYYYMLFFAGDILDTHFGMSMAKVFDPGTNIQMSVSGTLLNLLFVMYIFATDSHLLLIRIFAGSFQVLPAGAVVLREVPPGSTAVGVPARIVRWEGKPVYFADDVDQINIHQRNCDILHNY